MRQRRTWLQWIFVHLDPQQTCIERECGSRFVSRNEPFFVVFSTLQSDLLVTLQELVIALFVCWVNVIMVCCVSSWCLQLFAMTNLPRSSCAHSFGSSFRFKSVLVLSVCQSDYNERCYIEFFSSKFCVPKKWFLSWISYPCLPLPAGHGTSSPFCKKKKKIYHHLPPLSVVPWRGGEA